MPICPVQAKYSALKTVDMLLRNRTVVLQDRTIASSFVIDPATKRVLGVNVKRYTDPSSSRFMSDTVYGNAIVLAGNAIENAKLMLNDGIAQGNPNLGANLMDHPYMYLWGTAPEAVYPFRGPDTTSGIDSLRDGPYRAKHSAFRASISNWGWSGSPKADLQSLVTGGVYGPQLRSQLADVLSRQMKLGIMLEQLPDPHNKVTVSAKWVDRFGESRPVLNYDYSPYVLEGAAAAVSVVQQIFAAAGIVDKNLAATPTGIGPYGVNLVTYGSATYAIMGAGHIVGTHRIGRDATNGVTDTNGLVFGYPNLYAVGCGSMVTIGTSNPTLTAVALAHKAGDAIVEALR
jgi:choline dehydrogenase-like flavoprotein